jgi:hypothetical protein
MFDKKLKVQLAAMEKSLQDEKDATDDMLVILRDLRRDKAAVDAELHDLKNNQPQLIADLHLAIARLEGQLHEAHIDAAKYHAITDRHEWRIDGKSAAHGETWLAYNCAHCKNDLNANPRILVPEGFFDSERKD